MPLEEWRSKVYVKINLPTVLNRELKKKRGFVTIGTVTDAYQPAEKKYEITRKSLEVLLRHRTRISILTKSSLILRDADLLERFDSPHVGVTITTLDDELRRKIEPKSDSVDSRIKVLEEMHGKVITYAFIGPIFPEITEPYIEDILTQLKGKVDYVIFDRFRWKKGMQLPKFLQDLDLSSEYYNKIRSKIFRLARERSIRTFVEF